MTLVVVVDIIAETGRDLGFGLSWYRSMLMRILLYFGSKFPNVNNVFHTRTDPLL